MITSLTVNFIVYATMDEREGFTAFVVPHVIIQRAAWMLIKANEQQQTTRKESEFLNCMDKRLYELNSSTVRRHTEDHSEQQVMHE